MTEQEREDQLLAGLLDLSESQVGSEPYWAHDDYGLSAAPVLSRSEELALLSVANRAGTPTLAPAAEQHSESPSFISELAGVVRRYPVPTVLAGAGLMFLLSRRRR